MFWPFGEPVNKAKIPALTEFTVQGEYIKVSQWNTNFDIT